MGDGDILTRAHRKKKGNVVTVGPLQAMWAFEPVVLTSWGLRTSWRFKKLW